MRFLHTSDWHLGQKFLHRDRTEEHELALEWLIKTIEDQKIDCLIIAGDIFDIGNPPNYARRMY
ncbi:MAG: exonuclease subunit SbcD, partial [Bacteroidota bacterium]